MQLAANVFLGLGGAIMAACSIVSLCIGIQMMLAAFHPL